MALVHTIGIGIMDFRGKRKSMAVYVPATVALATVQTELNTYLPQLDAAIDGKIVDAEITMGLSLPGGMKGAAVTGTPTNEGALSKYSAAATAFTFGLYVPTWKEAGFAVDAVLNTGVYATANGGPVVFLSDTDGNALTAWLTGRRAFRK